MLFTSTSFSSGDKLVGGRGEGVVEGDEEGGAKSASSAKRTPEETNRCFREEATKDDVKDDEVDKEEGAVVEGSAPVEYAI